METPFYRNLRGLPVEPAKRKPKVVSVPVHFVTSEKPTRSSAATKIQKAFRGFLVRKSVKKIASIRREVEAIERRVSGNEGVEVIRKGGEKERLRLNEMLMALLFKLDSVRGVDEGVRELRKGVIRKAIALQERVDAIAAGEKTLGLGESEDLVECHNVESDEGNLGDRTPSEPDGKEEADVVKSRDLSRETSDESGEVHCPDEEEEAISETVDDEKMDVDLVGASHASEIEQSVANLGDSDNVVNQTPSLENGETDAKEEADDFSGKTVDEIGEVHCPEDEKMNNIAEGGVGSEAKEDDEGCIVKQVIEDECPRSEFLEECEGTDSHVSDGNGDQNIFSERQKDGAKGEGDDQRRDTELLERMVEENKKMMSMMMQLYEKNEVQTQMLSLLTHRVEQLERALICERLRKKKKRHAAGRDDCSEAIPDQKKCGKR